MTCPFDPELHGKDVGDRTIKSHPLFRSCKTRAASPQRMGHPAHLKGRQPTKIKTIGTE